MRVIIVQSAADVARTAADHIATVVRTRQLAGSAAVLGVATGSSPLGTYAELGALANIGEVDLTGVRAFANGFPPTCGGAPQSGQAASKDFHGFNM